MVTSLGSALVILIWLTVGGAVGYWLAARGRTSDTRLALDAARRRHLEEVFGELQELQWTLEAVLTERRALLDGVRDGVTDETRAVETLQTADLAFRRRRYLLPGDVADAVDTALAEAWTALTALRAGALEPAAAEALADALRGVEAELRRANRVAPRAATSASGGPDLADPDSLDAALAQAESRLRAREFARPTRTRAPRNTPVTLPPSDDGDGSAQVGGSLTFGPRITGGRTPGGSVSLDEPAPARKPQMISLD